MRTPVLATVALAFLSSAALAQPVGAANGAPAPLHGSSNMDDDNAPPPPQAQGNSQNRSQNNAQAQRAYYDRDMFCRNDAARRTGYTTPDEAASDEQARGSIGGTLGGAALGAIIGGASGNAGAGAAIGAGAGLIAGTAVGANNANHAARDVQAAYGDAYNACMGEAQDDRDGGDDRYAGDYPPPPGYAYPYTAPPYGYPYYGYPYPYPYYGYGYGPYYRGPGVSFGFGFGGYRGGFHGHR